MSRLGVPSPQGCSKFLFPFPADVVGVLTFWSEWWIVSRMLDKVFQLEHILLSLVSDSVLITTPSIYHIAFNDFNLNTERSLDKLNKKKTKIKTLNQILLCIDYFAKDVHEYKSNANCFASMPL